jgi:hypothetical protein
MVVLGYSLRWKRPVQPLLFISIGINLITQSILWIGLNLFFQYYLITLLMIEIAIWMMESFLLYSLSTNGLCWQEAVFLSLLMNLTSFALGWFLPL